MRRLMIGLVLAHAAGCAAAQAGSNEVPAEHNTPAIPKTADAAASPGKTGATAAASAASAASAAAPKDPLLAPFLALGSFSSMALSPDGKHIATLLSDGFDSALAIIDADTMEMRNIVEPRRMGWRSITSSRYMRAHTRSPRFVAWATDDLLAVNFNDGSSVVTLDGKETVDMFAGWCLQIRDANGHATDWAIVQRDFDEPGHLSRLNVRTGENYSVDVDVQGKLVNWLADAQGNIRVATTMDTAFWSDATRLTTWMRASDTEPWRKIDERSILDDSFRPLQIVAGTDHLIVQARNGGDRLAV